MGDKPVLNTNTLPLSTPALSSAERSPLLVSVMFRISGKEGHPFTYNLAGGQAAAALGWQHQAAVHAGCTVWPLPTGWSRSLEIIGYRHLWLPLLFGRTIIPDVGSVWRAVFSVVRYLRQEVLPQQRPTILFLEFFTVTELAILVAALAQVPRKLLSVCLLYRVEVHKQPTRQLYRVLNGLLRWQVGEKHFTLLSDSRPLAESMAKLFGQPVQAMPIPHAAPLPDDPIQWPQWEGQRPQVVAWWPGRTTADKGLAIMTRLVQMKDASAEKIQVVAAASSGFAATAGGCAIRLLPNELSSPEYWGWMLAADVILLPYDLSYAERTSGIFVEAITAGKLALTTAGTWMAGELLAHGLPELIMDWSSPRVWETVLGLTQNVQLRRRLAAMQADYQRYHSLAGFAAALQAALAPALP
jgi:hypothetical protein